MPPLVGGLYYRTMLIYLVRAGGHGIICYQVIFCLRQDMWDI